MILEVPMEHLKIQITQFVGTNQNNVNRSNSPISLKIRFKQNWSQKIFTYVHSRNEHYKYRQQYDGKFVKVIVMMS